VNASDCRGRLLTAPAFLASRAFRLSGRRGARGRDGAVPLAKNPAILGLFLSPVLLHPPYWFVPRPVV